MSNGYFPGKKKAKRSGIVTPRTAQETQIAAMPRMSREARQALRDAQPLRVGGADLVEGADRIMRTPAEHQAAGVEVKASSPAAPVKVARIYMRVSTDAQDLARQEAIATSARAAGFYVAGIYREKASGARADRVELLRMIDDLQPGEAVVAEKIDRISRLPLEDAEKLVASIRAKGARLAVPGIIDLGELAAGAQGVARIVLESVQDMLLKLALQMAHDDYEDRRERQRQGIELAKVAGRYAGRTPDTAMHERIAALRAGGNSIAETAKLAGCSISQVKRVCALLRAQAGDKGELART
uniref:ParA n=1 Tax=Collimonas fungivorans (strain Ter331) TaxID=1005048 RepID=B0ZB97_COLFT|nr:recombinase family protein [Collimonas fungivorans]ABZ01518.1 ParA [Collimonas fungivorans Ter331]BCT99920.1 resolvase [uncultured bacterium]